MPAWLAASVKVGQARVRSFAGVRPGSILELPAGKVTEPLKRSLPVNCRRISAPAALKLLCPDGRPHACPDRSWLTVGRVPKIFGTRYGSPERSAGRRRT